MVPSVKKSTDQYGDLVVWHEIMEYAARTQRPIILITDDQKPDWWQQSSGKTVGPRPELVQEMLDNAHVQFYMYTPKNFLERAQSFLGFQDSQAQVTVDEVDAINRADAELFLETLRDENQQQLNSLVG